MTTAASPHQKFDPRKLEPRPADIARLIDKLPPHAIEAEMSLLGSMLIDWHVTGEVVQIVRGAEDFHKTAHGVIYDAMVHLYDQNQSLDLVQLRQRLADVGQLENVGGVDYLLELAESVPNAASAAYYARIVRDKSTLRKLIDAAGRILYDAHTSAEKVSDLLDKAEQEIFKLAEFGSGSEPTDLKALLQETFDRLQQFEGAVLTGMETGFYELDEKTCGLQKGEMIVLAARPSMGKTALALTIAEHMAATNKKPIGFFSLEMSRQQLAQRLLCSRSGVDSHRFRRNTLSGEDYTKLTYFVSELSDAPMYIDDTPGLTLLSLRAKARRLYAQKDIQAIFVDYLQLMSAPGSENRQQEVSTISRGIKALAREINVPVICLSQLNRSPEGRDGHKPRMSDLRESGSIEQDADVVLMLHREEYYHDEQWRMENPDKVGVAELIISKQRNGPTGEVKLQFNAATTRFNNLSTSTPSAPPAAASTNPAPF